MSNIPIYPGPSVDTENMEDSVKEVTVFQRVRQEKENPQAVKQQSSTGSR